MTSKRTPLAAVSAAFLLWGYLAGGSDEGPAPDDQEGSAPAVVPSALPGGIGLGLMGRF